MAEERHCSLTIRLSRLETELDQLILLQESNRGQRIDNVNGPAMVCAGQNCQLKQGQANNLTTRKTISSNHRHCCTQDQGASAPLADISKFLQHINLNISKGTQAIAKIATSTTQENSDLSENKKVCNNYSKKGDNNDDLNVGMCHKGKKINEDDIFRELRDEKDKRMRADNLVKCLKEELKKTKSELQQKAETTIRLLQEEIKEKSEKLNQANYEIQKRDEEYKSYECFWPLKYESANKELQNERNKRKEAEANIRQLHDTLQKLVVDTEEHLTLQKTASWLKNQNENLLCLTTNLKREIDTKNAEICRKNLCIDGNLRKIKQLTDLCGKLRDFLVVMREKVATSGNKLRLTMDHCQRLAERLLHDQSKIEDLKKCQNEDKNENSRLSELLKSAETKILSISDRLEEMSEVMKKQNELITSQATAIDNKEEQRKLAYENIKLQSQRLVDLENKLSALQNFGGEKQSRMLQAEHNRLLLDLESEKENVMIKEKIIDSHLQTISEKKKELLKQETELHELRRHLSEVERNLSVQKTTNEGLLSKIKQFQLRKDELKRRIEDLEEEVLQSSEHNIKLEQIERQIQRKQKEWEELKKKLIKEKDDAIEALEYSTQKLREKTGNYEKEMQSKQELVDRLISQVQEKDKQLQEAQCEITRVSGQLQETEQRSANMKKHFERALQAACESWQKTMEQVIT